MASRKKEEFLKAIKAVPVIEADFMVGLTPEQVRERKDEGFVNKISKKVTKTYWQIFCDNLFSFFNMVFFGIAILMAIAGIGLSSYFFLLPILSNIVLGLITDIRARRLVDKLRLVTDPKVSVVRDSKQSDLWVDDVVLGDIVVLSSGDQICADALVVNGRINVDESLLTGESDAVSKFPGAQVFSGSFVISGKAYVRVNRVGIANYAEGLQDSAKRFERPNSELKSSSLKIFWTTGIIAIVLGLAMTITWLATTLAKTGQIRYGDYQDFIRKTLSGSMEAMIPAGLYLLTSLTLGVGVINLAKKRMNVQELYSLEMLARVDTICFDKTGTLTDGNLSVKEFINVSKFSNAEIQEHLASLCKATGDDNSTAKAIRAAYKAAPYSAKENMPFDSAHKFSAAYFEGEGTYILGAPGFVDCVSNPQGEERIALLASKGYRVVAVFFNKKPLKKGEIPVKSQLVALVCLSDHVKPDAAKTIGWFRANGVAIKVISGDNPLTVSQIAGEVGVPDADKFIEMDKVKDEDIPTLVDRYTVFGRVKPEQKALLVSALREEGHKVAMTGDGVNDILALKGADCSIAMASGSSAARNVAHIVSLDNDFSKLPDIVAEGRRVINNLERTATLFLTKTVFAIAMTLIFLVVSWVTNNPHAYPFTTNNMYVWEIVTIGGGGLFLSLQPSKERLKGSYLRNVLTKSAPGGLVAILAVCVFFISYAVAPDFMDYQAARALSVITFTALSYCVLFRVSLPFDNYRTIVFVVMMFFGVLFFFLDIYFTNINSVGHWRRLFGIDYNVTLNQMIVGGVTFIVMVVAYFLLDWGSRHISAKYDLQTGGSKQ
ncbi:MAG: HAD-IC family P-type ATPase [Bacilli bacterium]